MIKVALVARPSLAWGDLLKLTQAGLARSISTSIDSAKWSTKEPRSAVAVLAEFQQAGSDPTTSLRDPSSVLRHLSYSFLVSADRQDFYEIAADGSLHFLLCEEPSVAIVSANLEQWRNTIVIFCKESATHPQREFAFACLESFDRVGLSMIFDSWSRRPATKTLVKK